MTHTEVLSIINAITMPYGWELHCSQEGSYGYMQVADPKGTDNVTGEPYPWKGRKWLISSWITPSEVLQTALMATLAAVEHETREQFLYKGQPIFDPHMDIEALHVFRMANLLDKRDEYAFATKSDAQLLEEVRIGQEHLYGPVPTGVYIK